MLCNVPLLLNTLSIQPLIGKSDHDSVQFSVSCSDGMSITDPTGTCDDRPSSCRLYDWEKADYDGVSRYLSQIDWQSILSYNLTADSLWSAFTDVMRAAIDMYVPAKTVNHKRNITSGLNAHLKHYPKPIKYAMYRKKCLWKFHRLHPGDPTISNNYRNACDECRRLIQEYEASRENAIVDANNLGKFYRFVNKRRSCRSGVGTLCDRNNSPITDDKSKATLLNEFFASTLYKTTAGHYKPKKRSQTASKSIQSSFRLKLYLKL